MGSEERPRVGAGFEAKELQFPFLALPGPLGSLGQVTSSLCLHFTCQMGLRASLYLMRVGEDSMCN